MNIKNDRKDKNAVKSRLIPIHLSVIMDGNGRWAEKNNLPRFEGHKAGVETVRMIISESIKLGIKILTLYAFSTENWKRPQEEISSLMNLFYEVIKKEKKGLLENGIKVRFIGHREDLSRPLRLAMGSIEELTQQNSNLTLNIAINYGGRSEICNAIKIIAEEVLRGSIEPSKITQNLVNERLFTADLPDPDLLIRTGGELRISNFLLWQIAYTELWFTGILWPDFSKLQLRQAIYDYEKRVRKFGGKV